MKRFILAAAICILSPTAPAADPTEVMIVVGPSNHPPGSHEVAAGGRLIAHCLQKAINVKGIRAKVFYEWPTDREVQRRTSTVVFIGDQFPAERLSKPREAMTALTSMMKRGCGIVCVHYATGLAAGDVADDGEHPLLRWTGGYFATRCQHHQSVARIFDATIKPGKKGHPVLRGWKTFKLRDEPYTKNYFGLKGLAPGVFSLATAQYPPTDPRTEIIAWGIERKDGGRGMGITMPHFYRNWERDELRKFIMNGIVWTAGLEVPSVGVNTPQPDLAAFNPESIDSKPRKKR
ncbi:MAG: ThuA domain-containing protein [Verrucomicrobiia bacterium]|jgi:type 1 glutamine amidotransferase